MILGTAGHVDHGKTALVKALTGIDTDRLPEEKRRGMTLELGFAHFVLPDGREVSIIDMPGHERFVKAMADGAGGVDAVMLVVAADEGVMPQTREHVNICTLLGVPVGVIVITKADLLPELGPEWAALLEADIASLVKGTFLQGAARVQVSAKTGDGLEALRARLASLVVPRAGAAGDGPFFMPIDRAFTIKGFGCVVTGTVRSGALGLGDEVELIPSRRAEALRLRGFQVHGRAVERVSAGQRAAVNVVGVEVDQVHRGMALVRRSELRATRFIDVELSLLPTVARAMPARSRQLMLIGTAQVEAVVQLLEVDSLKAGERAFAQVRFGSAIAALSRQRFIIRGTHAQAHHGATIGGGKVLAIGSKRRRRGSSAALSSLAEGDAQTRVLWLLAEAGIVGLAETELFALSSCSLKELVRTLELAASRGRALLVNKEQRRWLSGSVFAALVERAAVRLETGPPGGIAREELRQRLGLLEHERTFARLVERLREEKRVEEAGELVRMPGRGATVDAATAATQARVLEAFASSGLAPIGLDLLASRLGLNVAKATEAVKALVREGSLIKAGELYFERGAVSALEARVNAFFDSNPTLTTADFKGLVGQSRKFAMPLAEYFDAQQLTLRVGDVRTRRKTRASP